VNAVFHADTGLFIIAQSLDRQAATNANDGTISFTCRIDLRHAARGSHGGSRCFLNASGALLIWRGWWNASASPASCRLQSFRRILSRSALLRVGRAQFGLQIFASQWFTTSLTDGANAGIVATGEMRIAHRDVLVR
jgi:hypothetical protein